ncbi:preprotein translocase subunit YajC [Maricaulis sp. CAU 1757]
MEEFLVGPIPMLILMGLVFYFLIIRPQQKRMKEHKEMVESLKRGDEVVTQGGLIGKVSKVEDDEILVKLADGVDVRVVRATITGVRGRPEPKPANDAKS